MNVERLGCALCQVAWCQEFFSSSTLTRDDGLSMFLSLLVSIGQHDGEIQVIP